MLTELILLHWLLSSNYWITQAASFMAIKQVLTNLIIDDPNTPCILTPQTHTGLGVGQDTGFILLSCLLGAAFNQFAQIYTRIPILSATPGNNSKTRYDKFKPYLIIN